MIACNNIYKSFSNKLVLENINLNIKSNEIFCLLGNNGAGKSTLINLITQTTKPDKGEIYLKDALLESDSIHLKKIIGFVSQDEYLIEQLTGYEYLNFQCLIYNIDKKLIHERIKSLLDFFFDDFNDAFKLIKHYSLGMRMRLKIIRSLIHKPNILIMDEPFANLDSKSSEKLILLLESFINHNNNCVLLSSHDLLYVDKIATHIVVLDEKKVIFNGTKFEFTSNSTYSLFNQLSSLINRDGKNTDNLNWLWT